MALSKITTASLSDDSVTGAKVENNPTIAGNLTVSGDFIPSTSLSTQNILINGDMTCAQRASSSTVNGVKTVDRWGLTSSQVACTKSQEPTATSDAPYQHGFTQFLRMEVTSGSSNAASYAQFVQQIEARNILRCGWNYKSSSSHVTLSFWARSSLAGTYHAMLYTTDMSPNKIRNLTFVLSANTWTKVALTFEGDSSLVINNDTGPGLLLYIIPYYGPSFSGTGANNTSWYTISGQDYVPDFLQNWGSTNGRIFDVTGVQLEVGQSATPYKHETFAENLFRCQRYYETCMISAQGYVNAQQHVGWGTQWKVTKRDTTYSVTKTVDQHNNTGSDYNEHRKDLDGIHGYITASGAGNWYYYTDLICDNEFA